MHPKISLSVKFRRHHPIPRTAWTRFGNGNVIRRCWLIWALQPRRRGMQVRDIALVPREAKTTFPGILIMTLSSSCWVRVARRAIDDPPYYGVHTDFESLFVLQLANQGRGLWTSSHCRCQLGEKGVTDSCPWNNSPLAACCTLWPAVRREWMESYEV